MKKIVTVGVNATGPEIGEGTDDKDKFMELARERFKMSSDAMRERHEDYKDDSNFRAGEQWDKAIKVARSAENRPCLTVNRLPQFERNITNDLRQNRPAMLVSPTDQDDMDTSTVIQGLLRHIEDISDAEVAYDTAATCAVRGGFGYYRVRVDYLDPMGFDQDILIERIRNPLTVYPDPRCQKADYSDAEFYFIVSDILRGEFEELYPDALASSAEGWQSLNTDYPDWCSDDSVRLVEYFYIEREKKKIVKISSGDPDKDMVLFADVLEKDKKGNYKLPKGFNITATRDSWIPKVKWSLLNGIEPLEETEWMGSIIPVIPTLGDEIDIDGKIILESAIRHAKDPQKLYNIWNSAEAEMIGLAPKAPWVGAVGQFETMERDWAEANVRNIPYLQYDAVDVDGKPMPPPTRNTYEPPTQAIGQAKAASGEDIKATIGIYDAGLGMNGNETSGLAIAKRQQQGQLGNLHFADNQKRGMKLLGRICVELIPLVYDTKRTIRIVDESGVSSSVKINQQFTEDGATKMHDMANTKYAITISSGPSYQTKRQEAANVVQDLVQSYPPLMQVAGDLLVRNLDIPAAAQIADRLHQALPTQFQDTDTGIPPHVKNQMDQQTQMIQTLTAELHKLSTKLEGKVYDIQSKERMNAEDNRTKLVSALIQTGSSEAKHGFQMEMDHVNQLAQQGHEQELQAVQGAQVLQQQDNEPTPPPPAGSGS